LQREIIGESRTSQGVGTRTTFEEGCWNLFWRLFSLPSGIRNRKKDQTVGERRVSRCPLAVIFRGVGAPIRVSAVLCKAQSTEVFAPAKKFFAKGGKFSNEARKFPAKFDVFRSKRFMSESERDVNQSLQVEPTAYTTDSRPVLTRKILITSDFPKN
jgi:hypothetical protein